MHLYFPGQTEESHKNLNHDNVQHYDYSLLGCVCRNLLLQKHMLPLSSGYKNVPQISHSSALIFHLFIHPSPLYKGKYRAKYKANSPFCRALMGCGMRLTEVRCIRYLCMSSKSTGWYVIPCIWSVACRFVWVNVECLLKKLGQLQHATWQWASKCNEKGPMDGNASHICNNHNWMNIMVDWRAMLVCIWKVPGANISQKRQFP